VKSVYVLVRADSTKTGLRRVIRAATIAGWWDETYRNNITVWPGDLEKAQLGLSVGQWGLLNGTNSTSPHNVNAIVHNGAVVNWYLSYAALKLANINSTAQLLRTAVRSKSLTKFFYVSGGSQWNPEGNDGCFNHDRLARNLRNTNGYGQSKLIAEQLVARTARTVVDGKKVFATLKPGLVIGSQHRNGVANTDDFIWRLVKGCAALGSYCDEGSGESWIYLSRGEDIGRAMMEGLSSDDTHWEKKMVCGLRVKSFWTAVNAALTQPLKGTSYQEWLALLRSQISQQGAQHPCWPVMHFLELGSDVLGSPAPPKYLLGGEVEKVEMELKDAVTCNVKYLQSVGFFGDSEVRQPSDTFARGSCRDLFHHSPNYSEPVGS
jgi:thioester reductase-like protein